MRVALKGVYLGSAVFDYKGRPMIRYQFVVDGLGPVFLIFPSDSSLEGVSFGSLCDLDFRVTSFGGNRGYRFLVPDLSQFSCRVVAQAAR